MDQGIGIQGQPIPDPGQAITKVETGMTGAIHIAQRAYVRATGGTGEAFPEVTKSQWRASIAGNDRVARKSQFQVFCRREVDLLAIEIGLPGIHVPGEFAEEIIITKRPEKPRYKRNIER